MILLFGLIHHAEFEALPIKTSFVEEVQAEIHLINPWNKPWVASSQKSHKLEHRPECHAKHEDQQQLNLHGHPSKEFHLGSPLVDVPKMLQVEVHLGLGQLVDAEEKGKGTARPIEGREIIVPENGTNYDPDGVGQPQVDREKFPKVVSHEDTFYLH